MIYHTIHTITIDEFGLAFKQPDIVNRLPFKLPKKWVLKAFNKLVNKYNEATKTEDQKSILADKYQAFRFECKVESLLLIYKVLSTAWMGVEIPASILELFKEEFGKDLKYNDYAKELERITDRIDRYKDTYKRFLVDTKNDSGIDFIELTIRIGNILGNVNIGIDKLYKMPYYIEKATKTLKQNNKQ